MEYQTAKDTLDKYERDEILDEFKELEEAFIEAVEEGDPDDIIDLIEDSLIPNEAEARGVSEEDREKYYRKLYKSWGGSGASLKKVKRKNLKISLADYKGVEYAIVTHKEGKPLLHASGSQDNFYMSVDYKKDEDGDWFFESFNLDLKVKVAQKQAAGKEVVSKEKGNSDDDKKKVEKADLKALPESEKDRYTFKYETNDPKGIEVYINGYPLITPNPLSSGFTSGSQTIAGWIMPGKNELRVKIEKEVAASAQLSAVISASQNPAVDEREVVRFEYPEEGAIDKVIEFTVKKAPPSDFWEQAETIVLDDATKQEALDYLKKLHAAFTSGDVDTALEMMGTLMLEGAKVTNASEEAYQQEVEGFKKTFHQMKLMPLVLDNVKFDLAANGKILMVTVNGISPLKIAPMVGLPVNLGRFKGKPLTMVR